jgi:hypothetical protein
MTASFIDHSSEMWKLLGMDRLDGAGLPNRSCLNQKGDAMKKLLVALATVATLAFSAAAPAHAQRALGAAIAGGLIGGAIVGGAIASSPYPYGPGYGPGPYYYGPRPYPYGGPAYVADDGYDCYWQRQRFWDGYAWRVRRVRVCD